MGTAPIGMQKDFSAPVLPKVLGPRSRALALPQDMPIVQHSQIMELPSMRTTAAGHSFFRPHATGTGSFRTRPAEEAGMRRLGSKRPNPLEEQHYIKVPPSTQTTGTHAAGSPASFDRLNSARRKSKRGELSMFERRQHQQAALRNDRHFVEQWIVKELVEAPLAQEAREIAVQERQWSSMFSPACNLKELLPPIFSLHPPLPLRLSSRRSGRTVLVPAQGSKVVIPVLEQGDATLLATSEMEELLRICSLFNELVAPGSGVETEEHVEPPEHEVTRIQKKRGEVVPTHHKVLGRPSFCRLICALKGLPAKPGGRTRLLYAVRLFDELAEKLPVKGCSFPGGAVMGLHLDRVVGGPTDVNQMAVCKIFMRIVCDIAEDYPHSCSSDERLVRARGWVFNSLFPEAEAYVERRNRYLDSQIRSGGPSGGGSQDQMEAVKSQSIPVRPPSGGADAGASSQVPSTYASSNTGSRRPSKKRQVSFSGAVADDKAQPHLSQFGIGSEGRKEDDSSAESDSGTQGASQAEDIETADALGGNPNGNLFAHTFAVLKGELLLSQLLEPEVIHFIGQFEGIFRCLFEHYCDVPLTAGEGSGHMTLVAFLRFCHDFGLFPTRVDFQTVQWLYHTSQSTLPRDITKDDTGRGATRKEVHRSCTTALLSEPTPSSSSTAPPPSPSKEWHRSATVNVKAAMQHEVQQPSGDPTVVAPATKPKEREKPPGGGGRKGKKIPSRQQSEDGSPASITSASPKQKTSGAAKAARQVAMESRRRLHQRRTHVEEIPRTLWNGKWIYTSLLWLTEEFNLMSELEARSAGILWAMNDWLDDRNVQVHEVFSFLDTNRGGTVSATEMKAFIKFIRLDNAPSEEEVDQLMSKLLLKGKEDLDYPTLTMALLIVSKQKAKLRRAGNLFLQDMEDMDPGMTDSYSFFQELIRVLKEVGMKPEEIFERLDKNGDGELDKEEITAEAKNIILDQMRPCAALQVESPFDLLDLNGDGKVTKEEFLRVVAQVQEATLLRKVEEESGHRLFKCASASAQSGARKGRVFGQEAFVECLLKIAFEHLSYHGTAEQAEQPAFFKALWLLVFLRWRFNRAAARLAAKGSLLEGDQLVAGLRMDVSFNNALSPAACKYMPPMPRLLQANPNLFDEVTQLPSGWRNSLPQNKGTTRRGSSAQLVADGPSYWGSCADGILQACLAQNLDLQPMSGPRSLECMILQASRAQ